MLLITNQKSILRTLKIIKLGERKMKTEKKEDVWKNTEIVTCPKACETCPHWDDCEGELEQN